MKRRIGGILLLGILLAWVLCASGTVVYAAPPEHGAAATHEMQGTETAHGEAAHGEAAHGDSAAKLWDLLYRTICFAILFLVLFFLLRKPLPKFLADRRASIQNELDELERKKSETDRLLKDLKAKVREIGEQREEIIAEYIREGEAEKAKILEQARLTGERIREQARWTIQQEIKRAKLSLQSEVAELATAMAEEVIRKNMKKEDEQRLIEEYIEKVVESA